MMLKCTKINNISALAWNEIGCWPCYSCNGFGPPISYSIIHTQKQELYMGTEQTGYNVTSAWKESSERYKSNLYLLLLIGNTSVRAWWMIRRRDRKKETFFFQAPSTVDNYGRYTLLLSFPHPPSLIPFSLFLTIQLLDSIVGWLARQLFLISQAPNDILTLFWLFHLIKSSVFGDQLHQLSTK